MLRVGCAMLQRQRQGDLQLIAQALLTNETLDRQQIQDVLAGRLSKQALAMPNSPALPQQSADSKPSSVSDRPSQADQGPASEAGTSGRSDNSGSGSGPAPGKSSGGRGSSEEAGQGPGSIISGPDMQPGLAAGTLLLLTRIAIASPTKCRAAQSA